MGRTRTQDASQEKADDRDVESLRFPATNETSIGVPQIKLYVQVLLTRDDSDGEIFLMNVCKH